MLAVVPLYPPQSRVGAWIATHEHLKGLAQAGHTVNVLRYLGGGRDAYVYEGVTVWPAGVSLPELAKDADVIVCHMGDDGRAREAARIHGLPLVVMVHGRRVGSQSTDGAALVVCNSHATAAEFPSDCTVVIHPPFDPEEYRTTPGTAATLVNLSEQKGVALFYLLARALPEMQFLGVKGGYASQVVRQSKNVDFQPVTTNMRDDVYARTRVLLMPSKHETWGMVGIEAMCSGIPVIAHPTPGLRESLGDAGLFVDRRDLGGWRETLYRLNDTDVWTEASEKALKRVAQLDPEGARQRFVEAVEACV